MKAVKFKESDFYSIELNRGTYSIDGKIITVDDYKSKVQAIDINNIIPITINNIVSYYIYNGETKMTIEEYNSKRNSLLSKKVNSGDDYDPDCKWETLDDEFNYRKFVSSCMPIMKTINEYGNPILFEIENSCIDTGNPYIYSEYLNGGDSPIVFVYDRVKALVDITKNKFDELGFEFVSDIHYAKTDNIKKWGNSSNSGIRFVVAFGTYIFGDMGNTVNNIRGSLESLKERYNKDRMDIEGIIQSKYNRMFGIFDENRLNANSLIKNLSTAKQLLSKISYNKKSSSDYNIVCKKINESIYIIENSFINKP